MATDLPGGVADRFWPKVNADGVCWEWVASVNQGGYGQFRIGGRIHRAHRVAWLLLVGDISAGLDLDHLCRNRACVNPDHLEPVTEAVNVQRRPATKLRPQQAREIRERAAGGERQVDIAARFGIRQSRVSQIVNERGWVGV